MPAQRLPVIASDLSTWGAVLNGFLGVAHNPDGTLKDGLSVEVFGAVGDGVTDDSGAFQTAINAAATSGGALFIPPHSYLIGTTLTIPAPIRMIGLGGWGASDALGARLVAKAGLNADLITFPATPPIGGMVGAVFRDLIFDQQGASQTAGSCLHAYGAIHCLFDHCHFANGHDRGLHLTNGMGVAVGHHNRVVHCLFDGGTATGGEGTGLRMETSDENFVGFCDFENNGSSSLANSAHIYDLSGLQHIIGCCFVNGNRGIKVQGDATRVQSCTFDTLGLEGVRLNGNRDTISGCAFWNVGLTQNADAIIPDNVAEAVITSNQFIPNAHAQSAINLTSGTPSGMSIYDNNFNTSQGTWATGPINLGTGTGHRIHDNRGYNPVGLFSTQPAVPASGTAYTNVLGTDATVYIVGGTVTAISVAGQATGLTTTPAMVRVPAGATITLTYSSAPTWKWFGD